MSDDQPSIEQLERDAARQRERLGETVDQIVAKADVKSHARRRVHEVKERLPFVGDAQPQDAARHAAQVAQGSRVALIAGASVVALLVVSSVRRRRRRERERELRRLQQNPVAALLVALGRAREIGLRATAR